MRRIAPFVTVALLSGVVLAGPAEAGAVKTPTGSATISADKTYVGTCSAVAKFSNLNPSTTYWVVYVLNGNDIEWQGGAANEKGRLTLVNEGIYLFNDLNSSIEVELRIFDPNGLSPIRTALLHDVPFSNRCSR